MKPHIFIRTDGSSEIGLGHLVRCLALAHMLKDNFAITFFCKEIPDSMFMEIEKSGFEVIRIPEESKFHSSIKSNSLVILDGYHFNLEYQKKVKSSGAKLVCIDDLHDNEFITDLVINHAPGIVPQDYKAKPYTQFALGLEYALLRPAFLLQAQKQRKIVKAEIVMICFGGSDFKNLTQSILQVVLEYPQFKKIIVVTGPSYSSSYGFKQLVNSDPRIDHQSCLNEQQMLDAMLKAELVIVPASGILFEALAAGCLVISGCYVNNQKLLHENFRNDGLFVDASDFSAEKIGEAISQVSLSLNKPGFIDGKTAIRISKLFNQLNKEFLVKLRDANDLDIDLTFNWATNPEIRRFSFQQHLIKNSEHNNWFLKKLMDTNCFYLIVEYIGTAVGSIRFDIVDSEARISYLLDTLYHGQGLGQIILKKGIEWLLNENIHELNTIKVVSGEVMKSNFPSIKAFERLGFVRREYVDKYKFEKWLY